MHNRVASSPGIPGPAAKIRVVVADDHPVVRVGIVQALASQPDIEVVGEAVNGDDTLVCVRTLHPDVLMLDIRMPGLRAVDLLTHLATQPSGPRTLVMTGFADIELVLAMLRARATGYLLKDEDPTMIPTAVRAVARGETWLSAKVAAQMVEYTVQGKSELTDHDLSTRELEVLNLLSQGKGNQEIGAALHISERTVRYHLRNIYDKLGVRRRSEAIAWSARNFTNEQPE